MSDNRLLWLPGVLRAAGLTVQEIVGWQGRGHPGDGPFEPRAVMFHHDASRPGDSPGALAWLVSGFQSSSDANYDAQCWVDRYGTWHIVAAGRAQHAGAGSGFGSIPAEQGNRYSFGVETDHTTGEAWPPAQYAAVRTGMAAICKHQGWNPATAVVGHKEYAPGRKDDPDPVDMDLFRREVAAEMEDDMTPEEHDWLATTRKLIADVNHNVANVLVPGYAKLAGQVSAQAAVLAEIAKDAGHAVDLAALSAAMEAAAEKGAADALAHLRIVTEATP
jgi:hypothetical protein